MAKSKPTADVAVAPPSSIAKDEAELRLEKAVFGDDATFFDNLDISEDDALTTWDAGEPQDEDENLSSEEDYENADDNNLFFLDAGPSLAQKETQLVLSSDQPADDSNEVPAWEDSDDERIRVSLAGDSRLRKLRMHEDEDVVDGATYVRRLQQQFERLHPRPAWAYGLTDKEQARHSKRRRLSEDEISSDNDDLMHKGPSDQGLHARPLAELLRSDQPLMQRSSAASATLHLRPGALDIQRSKDVATATTSAITSLSFHPHHPLLLTSGPKTLLSLHQLAPTAQPPNPTLCTLALPRDALRTASFAPSGDRVLFAARRRAFYSWDLASGSVQTITRPAPPDSTAAAELRSCERLLASPDARYIALVSASRGGKGGAGGGAVHILAARTGQWVCAVRVEGAGGVGDVAWWRNGQGLIVIGPGGEAIEYVLDARRAIARWQDDGAVGVTKLALGGQSTATAAVGGDRWLATGSVSGIVNLYDRAAWLQGNTSPSNTSKSNTSQSSISQNYLLKASSAAANAEVDAGIPARPKPLRVIENLTTPISHLAFAPDHAQLLALASASTRDALRLVHLPSATIYPRWPQATTPLGRIRALAWSVNGRQLAIGSEGGKVRLWEIRG